MTWAISGTQVFSGPRPPPPLLPSNTRLTCGPLRRSCAPARPCPAACEQEWEQTLKAVQDPNEFAWKRQVRHYWDKEGQRVVVWIGDVPHVYGTELLPQTPRPILTPDTTKAFFSLAQAMHSRRRLGLVVGTSESSAAATIADFASVLGRWIVPVEVRAVRDGVGRAVPRVWGGGGTSHSRSRRSTGPHAHTNEATRPGLMAARSPRWPDALCERRPGWAEPCRSGQEPSGWCWAVPQPRPICQWLGKGPRTAAKVQQTGLHPPQYGVLGKWKGRVAPQA